MVATATLLTIAAATSIVGAGISAYGMYAQGQSQKKMADYNAKVQENAAIASRQSAEFEANRIRDRARRVQGAQTAAYSKSGLMLSGSAIDVAMDSSIESEMDVLTTLYKGKTSADADFADAAARRAAGSDAASLGMLSGAGTLLGGFAQAGGYLGQANAASAASEYQPKLK
jgi:hypothetical protein